MYSLCDIKLGKRMLFLHQTSSMWETYQHLQSYCEFNPMKQNLLAPTAVRHKRRCETSFPPAWSHYQSNLAKQKAFTCSDMGQNKWLRKKLEKPCRPRAKANWTRETYPHVPLHLKVKFRPKTMRTYTNAMKCISSAKIYPLVQIYGKHFKETNSSAFTVTWQGFKSVRAMRPHVHSQGEIKFAKRISSTCTAIRRHQLQ